YEEIDWIFTADCDGPVKEFGQNDIYNVGEGDHHDILFDYIGTTGLTRELPQVSARFFLET
ncbi:unnamed protein product, partial [Didymodactylos carnosus]